MQTRDHRIVLHIDDDEDDRELVREGIFQKDKNIILRQVDNGKAGLSFLQQAKEFGDLPCLIILDLNMPKMDGRQVLAEIKKDQQLASIPLVIFTTSDSSMDKHFAAKEGVQLITKPPTLNILSRAMDKLLSFC
jgi:CheY-like chemotaxis protein